VQIDLRRNPKGPLFPQPRPVPLAQQRPDQSPPNGLALVGKAIMSVSALPSGSVQDRSMSWT
jgi:hypothetical protein